MTAGPDISQRRMRAFQAGFTDIVWFAGTASVTEGSGSVGWGALSIWYSGPGAFGGRPNSSASSVSSTHCPAGSRGWRPGPARLTQTVDPETLVIAVTTEPFSRDHFQVAWGWSLPWWISTRYSWFSMPW